MESNGADAESGGPWCTCSMQGGVKWLGRGACWLRWKERCGSFGGNESVELKLMCSTDMAALTVGRAGMSLIVCDTQ